MRHKDSYIDIVKSNSLFGGIKIFQIIVQILRIKIVAILLGPYGMGIQSLFTSTLASLHQFTSFGVFQSAVRDISISHKEDEKSQKKILAVVNVLVLAVCVFGFLICVIFSGLLSRLVFEGSSYTFAFMIIALALVFEALAQGQVIVFQGLRKLSYLGKGSLLGAVVSLIACIPLYYFGREKAIPYAITLGYALTFLSYRFYARKSPLTRKIEFAPKTDVKSIGLPILKLGFVLMLSNGLMALFAAALNIFIRSIGEIADVGFYNAAYMCTYGNMVIFASILASDYYPRLSASQDDKIKRNSIVNQQIELFAITICPVICLVILFSELVIKILLSSEFISVSPLVQLMALSLMFKVVWQSLSFVILSHGNKRDYFIYDALLGNGSIFILNLLGYRFYGLIGLSLSNVIGAFVMVLLLYSITQIKYKVKFNKSLFIIYFITIFLSISAFLVKTFFKGALMWGFSSVIITAAILFFVYILNKRISLKNITRNIFNGRKSSK